MRIAALSHRGQRRPNNEDAYGQFPLPGGAVLLAVADGLGGHQGGEIASQLAVATLAERLRRETGDLLDLRSTLMEAVEEAHRRIQMAQNGPDGMGTTLTAVLLDGCRLVGVHTGDSRAYLWRPDLLLRLTQDHSMVEDLVRKGGITAEEASHHPQRNLLTAALGVNLSLRVDPIDLCHLDNGARLLLCSDGLTSVVSESDIARILGALPVEKVPRALVQEANEAGGPDNITVIVASCEQG